MQRMPTPAKTGGHLPSTPGKLNCDRLKHLPMIRIRVLGGSADIP